MVLTFMIAICALAIALYVQAWLAAREVRRHRALSALRPDRILMLGSDR